MFQVPTSAFGQSRTTMQTQPPLLRYANYVWIEYTKNIPQLCPYEFNDQIMWKKNISQIVNGNKITINETTYRKNTPFGEQFVKVRTVHVAPLNPNEQIPTTDAAPAEPEPTTPRTRDIEGPDDDEGDAEVFGAQNEIHHRDVEGDSNEVTK